LAVSFGSTTKAATIVVPPGGNLQSAINAAQPGDRIILDANQDYICASPCVLPVKSGADFITIESSRYAEIPVRDFFSKEPTPAVAQLLVRIKSFYSTEPVFLTAPGAHHYKLLGLDLMPASGQATRIVEFGTTGSSQDTLAEVPSDLVIDKSWIHAEPTQDVQRCVALNSKNTDITNSWISECHGRGYDTQAIACWNGPGPYNIVNNYLEGAGENVIFGGSPASIPNLVPTGITIRKNFFFKPLSWYANDPSYAGIKWSVKNLFELKNSRQVVIDGNIFENTWTDAQAGRAIVFTPRPSDSGTWAVIEDVQFTNNIVRNVGSGMLILGADEPPAPTETRLRRVRVANNVWVVDGPRFGSNGFFLTVINRTEDVTIEHNTAIQTGNIIGSDYAPNIRFVYRDNISRHNEYGIIGGGHSVGNDSIAYYFPGSVVTANLIAKEVNAPWNVELIYPTGNFAPASLDALGFVDWRNGNYRLASSSVYKGVGTGGTDPGCDIDQLNAALGGSFPTPSPTPTPTATPTATPSPTPSPTPTPTATPTPMPNPPAEVIWVDDSLPAGAIGTGEGEPWTWIASSPSPISGNLANQSLVSSGMHQHYFTGATNTLNVVVGDTLVAHVFIDPTNLPSQIMLQWNDGDWEQRAYWGASNLDFGTENTNSRRRIGALPPAGQWVRLEVPASQVGLEGKTITGMAFTLFDGRATWDRAGKSSQALNGPNPIALTDFFVRQHYLDFLGREPDPAGFAAWQNLLNNCMPGDTNCDRVHVSGSFFQSPEFLQRGYFVYRFYSVSFGRKPDYAEFAPDFQKVSGFLSETQLEMAKVAFIDEFMARPAFVARFNRLNNTQYVDKLLSTAGITHTSRDSWISALRDHTKTRAQVLREIAESAEIYNKYFNQAFVVMQYFGYLRRQPDAQYLTWIAYLETTGDFRSMISGFMNSLEYRARFGP
jgi:hypothetical protein